MVGSENSRYRVWKPSELGSVNGMELKVDKLNSNNTYILKSIYSTKQTGLNQWEPESLDALRDNILTTKGNVTFNVTGANSIPVLQLLH